MIVAIVLALAFASGVDSRRIALLAAAIYLPFLMAALLALFAWKARPEEDTRPALFCESVASELRAGASLRSALTTSAAAVGGQVSAVGSAMPEVAARVAEEFPRIGEELRLTVVNANRTGSDTAALFDEIGALALAQSEIRREVRTATAPGRATALVLTVAAVVFVVSRLSSGSLDVFLASSQQRYVAVLGLGLFLAGLVGIAFVIWRASR